MKEEQDKYTLSQWIELRKYDWGRKELAEAWTRAMMRRLTNLLTKQEMNTYTKGAVMGVIFLLFLTLLAILTK